VLCAIDSAHSISFATAADLAAWGVSDDEALRTAAANLARMPCQVRRNGPMALILGPDGYVSSWLAAPAALARVAADIGGSVIAVAAQRDQLILIDAEHPEAAARMLEAVPSSPSGGKTRSRSQATSCRRSPVAIRRAGVIAAGRTTARWRC
jgi:hypothetical protein